MKDVFHSLRRLPLWLFVLLSAAQVSCAIDKGKWRGVNPYTGIKAKVLLRMVDDMGCPVEGVSVSARFDVPSGAFKVDKGRTDKNGHIMLEGRTWQGIGVHVNKDGYYFGSFSINFEEHGFQLEKGKKWLPYGKEVQYVIKKMHNRVKMCSYRPVTFYVPRANEEFGFDLEFGDYVAPYGCGKIADFYVKHTWDEKSREDRIIKTISFRFPNPLDGAYEIELDETSGFRTPYHADPNADYKPFISWTAAYAKRQDKTPGRPILPWLEEGKTTAYEQAVEHRDQLDYNEGIVMRTRTRVDADGKIISAHYSFMVGVIDPWVTLPTKQNGYGAATYYNPNENDTNLEYSQRL